MSYITHNIPHIECFVADRYLTQKPSDEIIPCVIHSVTTIPGQALQWNILLEDGSMYNRLPLWAFTAIEDNVEFLENDINPRFYQPWETSSADASVFVLDIVSGSRVEYKVEGEPDVHPGEYLFSIDFAGTHEAESFGDFGHKITHICKLDFGDFVAAVNSRLAFIQPAFTTNLWTQGEPPRWRSQRKVWRAERNLT